jgi:hypothetical protein
MQPDFSNKIFDIKADEFEPFAIDVFHFQYHYNPLYKAYLDTLRIDPLSVKRINQIPFLPIGFFKINEVGTTAFKPEAIFESSGTTGKDTSKHHVKNLDIYRNSFVKGFESFYGAISDWCVIGLLPSYLERNNSSLVFMVNELISRSHHADSGFYLHDYDRLAGTLARLESKKEKTLLIGVGFALLDFGEAYAMKLNHTIIMETGGMKGRKKEITRMELHNLLKGYFGVQHIHAEYGMTELLSQAYSKEHGIFNLVPWMRVLCRMDDDPFEVNDSGEGILNIIDLANIYSVSFIATDDMGKIGADGSFEIIGRLDNADLRGCSLLLI